VDATNKEMKKLKYLSLMLLLLTTVLVSRCNKKTYSLDPPPSKVEGLNGDWKLYKVIEVDEISLAKNERDISGFYIGDNTDSVLNITFNSPEKTFFITDGEIGRNYLPSSGTWTFDNDDFPQFLNLIDDEGEITRLKLQGPTRPQDMQLKFSFQRFCIVDDEFKEYVGYRYEFNRE
jgi:hypothetical protein